MPRVSEKRASACVVSQVEGSDALFGFRNGCLRLPSGRSFREA